MSQSTGLTLDFATMEVESQSLGSYERELAEAEAELEEVKKEEALAEKKRKRRRDSDADYAPLATMRRLRSRTAPATAPTASIVSAPPRAVCVSGIIGKDSGGNTYVSQKFVFFHDKGNKEQGEMVEERLADAKREWDASGCPCEVFTKEFDSAFVPSVVGGLSRGFANKGVPEAVKRQKKKA